jgi:hypothetical protein
MSEYLSMQYLSMQSLPMQSLALSAFTLFFISYYALPYFYTICHMLGLNLKWEDYSESILSIVDIVMHAVYTTRLMYLAREKERNTSFS